MIRPVVAIHAPELEDLERQAETAFLKYFSTKEELGCGREWSHVTEPLYEQWQDIERALAFVRCI